MTDSSILKSHLIASGRLTHDEILRAEDYALTMNMPLDEALIFLKALNYASLGQSLAEIHQKPYRPLLGKAPEESAKANVPLRVAESLHTFPVKFNPKENALMLAVDDPTNEDLIKMIKRSVSSSVRIDFTVASRSEITMAIDVYYKGRIYAPEMELHLPKGFTIVAPDKKNREGIHLEEESQSKNKILLLEPDLERSRAIMTILAREGFPNVRWVSSPKEAVNILKDETIDMLVANGRTYKPQGKWIKDIAREVSTPFISCYNLRTMLLGQEYPYSQMSDALISLITFIIRGNLQNNEEHLQEIVTTARYCKLLAMRLGLATVQVDGAVLAAWLSVPGIGKLILDHMSAPYPLEEIIRPDAKSPDKKRVEALTLSLVKRYQALKKERPEIAIDLDKVRRELHIENDSPEDRSLLEAFLNVIKDEEYLKGAGISRGRILIVDPEYSKDSALGLRLLNDGYEITGVSDARQAAKIIFDAGTDLVISEVNLPETDGIRFCRALRENNTSARIPFFFMTAEEGERLATQCLEAGADDFFKKPVDLEMLSIKVRNILALKTSRETRKGIAGTLQEMSATDIIQILTTGNKDVEVRFQREDKRGVIYIRQGQIIHAQTQQMEGQEAFYQLMGWQDGNFEITTSSNFPARTIHDSAMSLIMEGARMSDEKNLDDES